PASKMECGARPLRHRTDRLERALRGDQGQRSVQPRAARRPPCRLGGGRLGARGSAGARRQARAAAVKDWPLWEAFVRSATGLAHRHVGSVHAPDAGAALQNARDVYTRRNEGTSLWVVRSADITASDPADKAALFEPARGKVYRHPTFYRVP